MVIYFTGTGNSEYVAKGIAQKLNDEIVFANPLIKEGKTGNFKSEKPYIFAFPIYLSTIPAIFRDFIKASTFKGNEKAYFIPTCASADGSAPNAAIDLCKESNFFKYMGCQKVVMPQNYITLFKPTEASEKKERYKNSETVINSICDAIKEGKELSESPASGFEYWGTKLVEKWYNSSFTKTKDFCTTDKCVGCGLCAKNCPTNTIKMEDGKPVWTNKVCIHCMACINKCPKEAIEFAKKSQGKERHVCPEYPYKE